MELHRKSAGDDRLSGAHGEITVRSVEAFRRLIAIERDRADRYSGHFSLAEFSTARDKDPHRAALTLADRIAHRARLTDEFGWTSATSIGILLPETSYGGALILARQILERIDAPGPPPACSIYTYPNAGQPPEVFSPPQGETGEEPLSHAVRFAPEQELERLLAVPLPAWKRALDVTLALLALAALSPILLVIAAGIKLVSPHGPVLFRQPRVGYAAVPFMCLKFRTMHPNVESQSHQSHMKALIGSDTAMTKLDDDTDSRIIPFGRLLRLSGLDELPQLWNVVRGDMSLVGPRPCIPYEYAQYQAWQRRRASALPGLTGLWQVSGKNRTTFNEMVRYDITYSRSRSFWTDIRIMLKTIPAILTQVRDGRRPAKVRATHAPVVEGIRGHT